MHDGKVGIGETDPDSTLEVNGDIHVIDDLTVGAKDWDELEIKMNEI